MSIRAVKSAEPDKDEKAKEPKTKDSTNAQPASSAPKKLPKKEKPVYSSEESFIWIFRQL